MSPIDTVFNAEQYASPYPPGIESHFWHQARNRIVLRKLRSVLQPGGKVLDIGCGPGVVVDHLRRAGVDCSGVDPGSPRPATSDVAPFLSLGVSAFDLPAAVRNSYSMVMLMDVLEHLEEPLDFLRDCGRAFPAATHIFITLPARMEIWSSYDEYYGHYRRYTLESFRALATEAHLRVREAGYFFHALYAATWIALLGSKKRSHVLAKPTVPRVHALLGNLMNLEERLIPGTIPGSSMYALLERPL
jgi:SAM-dependent methyltransferase